MNILYTITKKVEEIFMEIKILQEASFVLDSLYKNNYDAYIVGGCVRDSLLGVKAKDWDITTNALPKELQAVFEKTIPTGIKHGTITVVINSELIEVTTYRIDGDYTDNRHPSGVMFTNSLEEDLSRRDFTINAMAYNSLQGLKDPFNGQKDLKNKLIKCVGDADLRFKEDALRMLRAIRFSSQLNFIIEKDTFKAICDNNLSIKKISAERVRDEFCKILISPMPSYGIRILNEAGLLKLIIPELEKSVNFDQKNPHHDKNIFDHLMSVMDYSENTLKLRLASLFHDIGKTITFSMDEKGIGHFYNHALEGTFLTADILKRLKFDNQTIKDVCLLIETHMTAYTILNVNSLKKLINKIGLTNLEDLFKLQIADTKGHAKPHDFSIIYKNRENALKILKEKQPLTIKDLKINGKDLMDLGILEGREIGILLKKLLEEVLINPDINTKEHLYLLIKEIGNINS